MSSNKHRKWGGGPPAATPAPPRVLSTPPPPAAGPAPPFAVEAAQVRDLVEHGRSKLAVDRAKEIHKRHNGQASEDLLVEAYQARILDLLDANMPIEARSLAELVRQRFPARAGRLDEIEWRSAAREGRLDFLKALAEPELGEERRALIERVIKREVVSLAALAGCDALPAGHPLRLAAAELRDAFAAVTSRPVAEEELALAGISRRSPLAPWKMLVLAIGALYRRDDDGARRYLEAVEAGSAPARLKPALLSLLDGKLAPPLASGALPGQARLTARVNGNLDFLRGVLRETDKAIGGVRRGEKPARALAVARKCLELCAEASPEFAQKLREQLVVRFGAAEVEPKRTTDVLGRIAAGSPNFFRLLARSHEGLDPNSSPLLACRAWEEFRRCAIQEKWFAEASTECAALYLHMASLVDPIRPEDLRQLRKGLLDFRFPFGEPEDRSFGDPRELYRRACAADPHAEAFERWMHWEKRNGGARNTETAAKLWHEALPSDIPPLLYLMDATEERGALQKSLDYIAKAEALDGLNPEVRRARMRLLFRLAVRNLKDSRAQLAQKWLAGMAELEQLQQGDRPALLAVLRWACAGAAGRYGQANERDDELTALLQPAGRTLLQWNVARMCGVKEDWPTLENRGDGEALAAAAARVCALGDEIGVRFEIPSQWVHEITRQLSRGRAPMGPQQLLTIGEAALRGEHRELAHAASAAGLATAGAAEARFLFLRARALPPGETERRNQCLTAVVALARQQRDMQLAAAAVEERQGKHAAGRRRWWEEDESLGKGDLEIEDRHLAALREQERKARSYPRSAADRPRYVEEFAEACDCPVCRAARGEPAFGDDDGDLSLPPELVRELDRLIAEVGPDQAMAVLAELAKASGVPLPPLPNPGRGRRKRRYDDDDYDYDEDSPF